MLLPTKGISIDRAIITIGAELLQQLEIPMSVTDLWENYNQRVTIKRKSYITFDWFSLALTFLFSLNLIEWSESAHLRRRSNVH